jgi:hypothetical protein
MMDHDDPLIAALIRERFQPSVHEYRPSVGRRHRPEDEQPDEFTARLQARRRAIFESALADDEAEPPEAGNG